MNGMNGLVGLTMAAACGAACLAGLVAWVRLAGSRSTAPAAAKPRHRAALAATLLLQTLAALQGLGLAGGLFVLAAAWMVVGWCFVLALNAAPAPTLRLAPRLGTLGLLGCAGSLLLR